MSDALVLAAIGGLFMLAVLIWAAVALLERLVDRPPGPPDREPDDWPLTTLCYSCQDGFEADGALVHPRVIRDVALPCNCCLTPTRWAARVTL